MIIDGKKEAEILSHEVKKEISLLKEKTKKVPTLSALNQVSFTRPGIASLLTPKAGSAQACYTSLAVIKTFTTLLTGTITSLSTANNLGWPGNKSLSSII